jgi:sec-independent protein translocase protein TatC
MTRNEEAFESTRMTLGEHLEELRKRIFHSVIVLSICFGGAWWYKERIAEYVLAPWRTAVERINTDLLDRAEAHLKAHPEAKRSEFFTSDDPANKELKNAIDPRPSMFAITQGFFFALNNSIYCALIVGSPFVLWQLWQFVSAGLYAHERRAVRLAFPFSAFLFIAGVLFSYQFVVPVGMYFLASTLPVELLKPLIGIEQYFSFLSTMCLAMGIVFQLPIVMIFLARMGLVEPKTYARYRGHFVVLALFVAAVVTPGPDYYSQILMTVPMLILYEVGILVSRFSARPRRHPATGGAS